MTPDRKISCTNEDGIQLVLAGKFAPFLLMNCEGIYLVANKVSTSENTMTDGSTYQGSNTMMRNIILTMADRDNHKQMRELLYKCFKPKSYGTFVYEEEGDKKQIRYIVETVEISSVESVRIATISLLCPDPFFVDMHDISVQMAGWESNWHWPHSFKWEGEPFAVRVAEKLKIIENDSAADNIGMTITIEAIGPVVNPAIYRVESNEYVKVGTTANPFTMAGTDIIEITTGTNNKHVYLKRGTTKTEINSYLSEDSEFIQLMRGANTIGYEADSGEEYMMVTVSYRYKYLAV